MTINYTTLLGLAKPVTGTETGQWGDVVNDEITSLLEDAVANAATFSVTVGDVTLSTTNGASNQARMSTLIITGSPGILRNVIVPSQAKIYVVINQANAEVVIKGAATTGVTVGAGQTAQIAWNGSDFVEIGNYVHGNFVVNGNLSVNGNSTLGNGGADTTTVNGQFIGANSNISKATTVSTAAPALAWVKGATYTDTASAGGTTQAHAPFTLLSAPTLATSNIVTYTNASTFYIAGAPSASGSATITNPYAMYVAAGAAYLGGALTAASSVTLTAGTANGVLYLDGSKVATSGTALVFDGTNLGVGVAVPGQVIDAGAANPRLRLTATSTGYATSQFINTSGSSYFGRDNSVGGFFGIANGTAIYSSTSDPIGFYLSGSEQMRLTSTGLGIGTSSPGARLDVVGGVGIRVNEDGAGTKVIQIRSNFAGVAPAINVSTNDPLLFQTNNTERMRLDSSGNLGLGVTPDASVKPALMIGNRANLWQQTAANVNLGYNVYESAANTLTYRISDFASMYGQVNGVHLWYTAPSGTAGNAITFTQAMTLDSSGNLGIGTSSPAVKLDVQGSATDFVAFNGLNTNNNASVATSSAIKFGFTSTVGTHYATLKITEDAGNDNSGGLTIALPFGGVESTKLTLSSPGNLGLGVTPSAWGNVTALQLAKTSASNIHGALYQGAIGANNAGGIAYNALYNGTTWQYIFGTSHPASRYEQAQGTHAWYIAGASTGTISFTQAMTLDASGNLGIGDTSPSTPVGTNRGLVMNGGPNGVQIRLQNTSTGATSTDGLLVSLDGSNNGYLYNYENAALIFGTNNTERARITSGGDFGIGTASPVYRLDVQGGRSLHTDNSNVYAVGVRNRASLAPNGNYWIGATNATSPDMVFSNNAGTERARITDGGDLYVGDTTNALGNTRLYVKGNGTDPASRIWANTSTTSVYGLIIRHESTTDGAYIQFVTNTNVETGRIYDSAGTMQYASSSDARLKTNAQPIQNGLQSVLALNPCTFDMRRGKDTFIPSAGLIAQEVHEIYPFAVGVGGDDENTNPWSVDYGKLTPLLVKAIQEQQAIINDLRARVAALEAA